MGGADDHAHAHAESTSSSFPHDDHRHVRKCSLEECNDDMIRPIFDRLVCDDVRDDEFELDSDGNIIPRFVLHIAINSHTCDALMKLNTRCIL